MTTIKIRRHQSKRSKIGYRTLQGFRHRTRVKQRSLVSRACITRFGRSVNVFRPPRPETMRPERKEEQIQWGKEGRSLPHRCQRPEHRGEKGWRTTTSGTEAFDAANNQLREAEKP